MGRENTAEVARDSCEEQVENAQAKGWLVEVGSNEERAVEGLQFTALKSALKQYEFLALLPQSELLQHSG